MKQLSHKQSGEHLPWRGKMKDTEVIHKKMYTQIYEEESSTVQYDVIFISRYLHYLKIYVRKSNKSLLFFS